MHKSPQHDSGGSHGYATVLAARGYVWLMNPQTASSPAVSVIVPLYNEEANVPILQSELSAALKGIDHEIIFVDDGSADRTVERIEAVPTVRTIRFEKNAGQSAAMF